MNDKPTFNEADRPFVDKARDRHRRRAPSPGVVMREEQEGLWQIESPHADLEAWEVQVFDAFGTRSRSTAWTFLDQLRGLVSSYHDGQRWRPNELELNALLNLVSGTRPRNEMQAALAAQMAATHLLTMRSTAAALGDGDGGAPRPEFATLAARLSRAFCDQMNTMRKLKSKGGRQHITVRYERHEHKHVHVHHEGGGSENRTQPHGPSPALSADITAPEEPTSRTALPGPNSAGK